MPPLHLNISYILVHEVPTIAKFLYIYYYLYITITKTLPGSRKELFFECIPVYQDPLTKHPTKSSKKHPNLQPISHSLLCHLQRGPEVHQLLHQLRVGHRRHGLEERHGVLPKLGGTSGTSNRVWCCWVGKLLVC